MVISDPPQLLSCHEPLSNKATLIEVFPHSRSNCVIFSYVANDSLLSDVRKMLDQLSQKERDVLIMRYGLDDDGVKKTLEEIGARYNVSRERIRQIENRAISKLKKLCRNATVSKNLRNYIGD